MEIRVTPSMEKVVPTVREEVKQIADFLIGIVEGTKCRHVTVELSSVKPIDLSRLASHTAVLTLVGYAAREEEKPSLRL